jgi:hypothetical protein
MANDFRIDYISQLKAFREIKVSTPNMTAGMVSVYYALLDMNNQSQWSEEFDVDFGYMLALSKVDKTTYYKAMDFFVENKIISHYRKGLNAYTRARCSLCLLYEKSLGNSLGKSIGKPEGESLGNSVSDHHYNKTLNSKPKKETVDDHFSEFWNIYDKKVGRDKTIKKWNTLTDLDKEEISKAVLLYVKATPDKKFRKDPLTYLNGKHWQDEIIVDTHINTAASSNIPSFILGQKPQSSTRH